MMQAPVNPMFHRHLVLGYSFAWLAQLSYLGYVISRRVRGGKKPL
jgi:hypothetical protein